MALYGSIQRNDAVPNAPQSTYGGMFARNDAPQASAPQTSSASLGMSETGYGRYGSRPRQDGGAWQGSRPGGTTGAIGGVRGGWGGAGGGWGQPGAGSIYANRQQPASSNGWTQGQSPRTPEMQAEMAANAAKRVPGSRNEFGDVWGERAVPPSSAQSMSPAPISYQTAELQRRAEAGGYSQALPGHQNTQQTYNGQPIDWSLPADKIPPPNAQQIADWERQSAIDTERYRPPDFFRQSAQMDAMSDFWANQRNAQQPVSAAAPAPISYQTADLQRRADAGGYPTMNHQYGAAAPASGSALANATNWANQMNSAPRSGTQSMSPAPITPTSNTQQPYTGYTFAGKQFTDYGGGSMENAGEFARKVMELNPGTSSPSVVPGIKSGPDEYGGAPAQTPSVQFNTPFQRLGVSGYGAGNAAQGAFSEQTGQVGAPTPTLAPARSMPSFMPSPFVGPTYGQPVPSVPDAGGTYGPGAVPTGMSSRYARQPVMRTLY